MKIKFLGASGFVTGSCYLLTDDSGHGVMVDMGMFQGLDKIKDLNLTLPDVDYSNLDGVILTHAHLDHCGRLPLLAKTGFIGKIYMTQATSVLTELALLDSAKIASEDRKETPLFTSFEVEEILKNIQIVDYGQGFKIGNFDVVFRDAGHILGSASIEVKNQGSRDSVEKITFSGDLGNTPEDLLKPTELIKDAEVVVMESTYGDRIHSNENASQVLTEEINSIEESGGVLLIPAFSVERSQEILHTMDHLKRQGKIQKQTNVFLDSPLAIKATQVYREFRNLYSKELAEHSENDDPFDFPGLVPVESVKESRMIHGMEGSKVIIAGSGMMTGGRILDHAGFYLPLISTRLLIVGYQAEGTLGRYILDGAKSVRIYGQRVEINASIRKSSGMSAHADQPRLIKWLGNIEGVKKVFLTHGDDIARQVLARLIEDRFIDIEDVFLPILNEEKNLG
ncbi:hypothetical protein A2627_04070 [Candidatus Woesebacteria bacterium RIFCSPHIGHO2_01_FULL_39_28]|uniref:MBL fold hydrolase n=1 Tax=Candidatus Woesebacteria bacterium RIFCSPHIGHO2_01_FULL_39_28 TaxID=1802496 RepID=A0A1F7YH95_9BACT|nr:MAG: hypothetical protein A2627_04070 [Candidatus Woesebacteria bacterium RIFCSPHIGHO2_01_FULL_39_28]OGM58672.1 MAG: hypothetical protein A3A50_02725 [Candidatus Woesebacteria bacterium RIFCSPLOWO2_01_FULL_38_20]